MKNWIEPLERRALLSGEIDTTFGTNGVTTTDFDAFSERFTEVATGPDGKLYAAGFLGGTYLVARYTPSGQLDTSFNGTGYATVPLTTGYAASGLAVSPAGEIFVGGSTAVSAGSLVCVVNLTADGQLDTTFDGDGVWTGTWSGQQNNRLAGLAYYDGRLYAGGSDGQTFTLARFTDAGTLDPAFGDNAGKVSYGANGTPLTAGDMILTDPAASTTLPRLLIGGTQGSSTVVLRYHLDGTRDTSFAVTPFSPSPYTLSVTHLAADSLGRVYVGGANGQRASVARLTNAGALDTSFAVGGYYTSNVYNQYAVTSLSVTGRRQVLFTAPNGLYGANAADVAIELTPEGVRNASFGENGQITLPTAYVGNAVTQADGRIVLVGRTYAGGDRWDTQIVRLNTPPMPSSISGFLFDDVNGDGVRNDNSSRTTFYGISAYLDLNGDADYDANEPAAYAGVNGTFVFNNVARGTYTVRLQIASGIDARQTYPAADGGLIATVTPSNPTPSVGPFGVRFTAPTYAVNGQVYYDINANGVSDKESGLAGRVVFVDADNDGILEAGEISGTTTAYGGFTLNLPAGNHTLRQVVAPGWNNTGQALTVAVNGATFGANNVLRVPTDTANNYVTFGTRMQAVVRVSVYNDADGDAVRDTNEGFTTSGGFVYADRNNNGSFDGDDVRGLVAPGTLYSDFQLPPGGYVFRQSLDSGWSATVPSAQIVIAPATDGMTVTLARRQMPTPTPADPAVTLQAETATLTGGTARGTSHGGYTGTGFADYAGNGSAVQWTVNRDAAGGATLDFRYANGGTTNRPLTVFVNGVSIGTLAFAPTGSWTTWKTASITAALTGGTNTIKAVAGPATGANVDRLTITAGTVVPPPPPPVDPPPSSDPKTARLSGFAFNDTDQDGVHDSGEAKTGGRTVFIDADNDAVLDSGERSVVTASDGSWSFTGLATGTVRVRQVFPSGTTLSTPVIDVTLTAGQVVSGLAIGSKTASTPPPPPPAATGVISGIAFNDSNRNGLYDAGDSVAPGKTIWLDLDDDGVKDSNEASLVTDSAGRFTFRNLPARTYHVRRAFPTGYVESTPARYVTLASGQTSGDVRIGSRVK